jgi:predicted permease
MLVVSEIALATVLLVGAALTIRTLRAAEGTDLGFRPERILTLRVPLSDTRFPTSDQRNAFLGKLREQMENIPGVERVGLSTSFHPWGDYGLPVEISGRKDSRPVELHEINAGYLEIYRIRVVAGRGLSADDVSAVRPVAVVNRAFVKRYFGESSPLGQTVRMPRLAEPPFRVATNAFEIVGVSADVTNDDLNAAVQPEVFVPYTISGFANEISIEARGEPSALGPAVRRAVYAVDSNQPVDQVEPLTALLDEWIYAGLRFNFVLFACFAGIGLSLTTIGVYGVISNLVSQRSQEIGVRIAVGASSGQILKLVISQGARLVAIGLGLGLTGSFGAARFLAGQLGNVSPFDPISYVAVSVGLCVVALLATLMPAMRAAATNPVTALRYE